MALVAAAVALASCGSSAANSSSTAAAACGPAGARTLAASGVARVYVAGKTAYGCSIHGSKPYRLGQRATCLGAPRVDPVQVSGELAAYGLEQCGVDTGSTQVVLRRLTDGRRLRSAPATTSPGVESYQSVGSLVLKSDGAVAWIGDGSSIVRHAHKIEVYKADSHGSVRLIDAGAAVAPGSLRLRGSKLTWMHGSARRAATLS